MIDDITPPQLSRDKPKRIEPLEKPVGRPLHELAAAEDPTFQTPEQVAESEVEQSEPAPTVAHHSDPPKKHHLGRFWPSTKKQRIISGVLVVLLAFGLGAGWTLAHHKRAVQAVTPPKKIAKKVAPQPIYSNLSGLPITDASLNQKPVTAVMVENSLDARPQSGLAQAGIVYEAVAEGGVTRFMALYQDTAPDNVGPIRSARPYYVQWAMGYGAAYAHVGGSPDALADITAWGVHDMNQFYNGSSYHRVSSRAAPHNVYTGISTLNQLEASKGFGVGNYTPFARKADAKSAQPNATSIDMSLSGYYYDPHYDYNPTTNSYNRSEAGQPQIDANTNQQLSPKVVVALVVPLSQGALDSSGAYYSNYNVIGSGQAFIFQDGTVTTGQWQKADNGSSLTLTDASGQPFALNRGQTWITAISSASKLTYK